MESLQNRLDRSNIWASVLRSPEAQVLLNALQLTDAVDPVVPPDKQAGLATLGVDQKLSSFNLNLKAPVEPRDYVLTLSGPVESRTDFRFALSLNEGLPAPLFHLVETLPGHSLIAATKHPAAGEPDEDAEWLEEIQGAPPVVLTGANVFLVMRGKAGGSAEVLLSSSRDAPDDVIVLNLEPKTVLLGSTGFGMEFTSGIAFDNADDAAPPDKTIVDGITIDTPADVVAWRGIAVRTARLFLPKGVPFLGGHAVDAHLQIGRAPTPGIDLLILTKVPSNGDRPGIDVRIECRDPTATGLDGFVPTLVEAVMELPTVGRTEAAAPGGPLTLGGGKPVRVRARFARKPAGAGTTPEMELSLAVESQGPDGLLKIDSTDGGLGAKVVVTAATLATALVADGQGPALHTLLTAAVGLSSFLDAGQLVMHRAEILTSGTAAPVGGPVKLKIDYSVAVVVTGIDVEVLAINMNPSQPMRVRVREVVLTFDPTKSGLEMINLDYTKSSLEIEDPGGWKVKGLDDLFDVLGTRSGRGSFWIEVDLRFKLDLGPVKVNGATIRATIDQNTGKVTGQLRGLDAELGMDPLIIGKGAVQLTEDGFHAALAATIVPLIISASADVETAGEMIKLSLGVDLPGPIPLANTGFGIYGFGGLFVANGRPSPVPPGKDAIEFQLNWDYRDVGSFVPSPDFSFGLEAVIGTAPDMGFTFSARAGIFLTTPDIVVRGSLTGVMMAPRVTISREEPVVKVLEAKGVVVIDPKEAVTIAVDGEYEIKHIVETHVPVAARFPSQSANWFIHLGSDGWTPPAGVASEGRESGPISTIMFPEIIGQGSDGYIMFRGNGITDWPRGGRDSGGPTKSTAPGTFVSAFGFGMNAVWGLKPIVWAELFARADIMFSTHPTTMSAMGRVGGDLHVGPFSVGVDASVFVMLMEGQNPYMQAEVCGTIDLFFHEIHKCVKISYNDKPTLTLPPPGPTPLDGPQSLTNDKYEVISQLFDSREEAAANAAVWPDAIPLLIFNTAPTLAGGYTQFKHANTYPTGFSAKRLGGELLSYEWELSGLRLMDATDPQNEKLVSGDLSASWQIGKFGDAGKQAQPAELALLTPLRNLWFDAFPDPGMSLPDHALDAYANICKAQAVAELGWAPGALASASGDGWSLPPDPISVDALQSQVHAALDLHWLPGQAAPAFVLDRKSVQLIPARVGFALPLVASFATPVSFDGRSFTGYLDVGGVLLPPGIAVTDLLRSGPRPLLQVTFAEPLRQARIWLTFPRAEWNKNRVHVQDDSSVAWSAGTEQAIGLNRIAVPFALPGVGEATSLTITYSIGMHLGVLGIAGVTHTAAAAADVRNAANQAQIDLLKDAAKDLPPGSGSPPKSTARTVLNPGSMYRVEVSMRWAGKLSKLNDKGTPETVAEHTLNDAEPTIRSLWFRTATADGLASAGTVAFFNQIHRRRDLFHPEMLERYLMGYEPAQSENFRFANDPARVYFSVSHVGALADVYGYQLSCGLRRLDAPADKDPDQVIDSVIQWGAATSLLSGTQKVRADAYAASACSIPPPHVMMEVPMTLSRQSWYEVFVLAKSKREGVIDGRLPGVSFRTSRWAVGPEMLDALHFRKVVAGRSTGLATGGAMLRGDAGLTPLVALEDDAAFDAFVDHVGLDGWPVANEPRTSLLWRQDVGIWLCAGVLIESPEPIHRPGRFEIQSLGLTMGVAGKAVVFDIRLRDRSGSRLLFATSKPFVPEHIPGTRNPPMLQLSCRDLPIRGTAVDLSGSLTMPMQPSFAEEAL